MQGSTLPDRERMLEEYRSFILKTASGVLHRYVTQSDDAWSIALIAFWEAAGNYREEKGGFQSYAQLVIRRRLIDDLRRQSRYACEIDVAPEIFSGDPEENSSPSPILKAQRASPQEERIQEEIGDVSQRLREYGFSFDDLVEQSPKAYKTKQACAAVSAYLLKSPLLIGQMRRCHHLPVKALALGAGVPAKCIDRHRNYIIAVVEILDGDYPELGAYLPVAGEGVER